MATKSTIGEVRQAVRAGAFDAEVHAQIEEAKKKEGSNGKPFWELRLRDAGDSLTLRVWSDTANFRVCESLDAGAAVAVEGEFYHNGNFGLDAKRWELRRLDPEERDALFAGSPEDVAAAEREFAYVRERAAEIVDPRLRALSERFLDAFGPRFARASAAKVNHHAERGGLLRHTAQMLRSALALAPVYPELNRDLLAAGVIFHDSGKLWETCAAEDAFAVVPELRGELMGHISIGVELVNALWRELPRDAWNELEPPSEDVRLHLIHLILSHHGELEFGSPVVPKTPEAIALHYIDNLDARLEMIRRGYETQPEIAPGIFERVRPLNASPIRPLDAFPDGR